MTALLAATGCGPVEDGDAKNSPETMECEESLRAGEALFRHTTFDGNGRTCETCHNMTTGTVSPAELQARYQSNPNDPIFRAIDSDDGVAGTSYNRLLNNATILVKLPLPPNARLASDPSATHVVVARGIPSTLDTPALDPILMFDGREPTLASQALSAVQSHYEPGTLPSSSQLERIARFERTLFSSMQLQRYAAGGPLPQLPEGNTESEKRGRAFFTPEALCGTCHGGPMLNEVPEGNMAELPPGLRIGTAMVSELNPANLPVYDFIITNPDGTTQTLSSPDPGRFLITGDPADFNFFKMVTLWNVKNTAPYFHDNSASTLEDVVEHYSDFFEQLDLPRFTEQETADIVAYMKLL